jgi:beta-phosphoglucomutase family hydrolase
MNQYKAFLFDLNGTMIDDMHYHVSAWHQILNSFGVNITLQQMKEECYGKNHELLERMFPGRFSEQEKNDMSFEKEKQYQEAFRPSLKLIEGLDEFLKLAQVNHIKMAIGSAAIMFNIDFVLDGLQIRNYFHSLISADDVQQSKPHPETYLKCAAALQVQPHECIVFEDAPKGVESAANAGMNAVVLTTMHELHEFASFNNLMDVKMDYRAWCSNSAENVFQSLFFKK